MLNLLALVKNPSQKQKDDNSKKNQEKSNTKQSEVNKENDKKQEYSHQSFMFKNSNMLKQQSLVSKFYSVISGADKRQVAQIKIQPAMLINKIQEPRLYFKSNIIYKQLAFDILLQSQITKTYKVKNCISPARPNSEIYKRLSKGFFENLKNGVDQCVVFTGIQNQARLQSSIGNQNNPGIFMIIAIAILDQKYKQNHERFDVQFSFLQFKGQKVYDLLNYTQIPLEFKERQHFNSQNSFQFKQHRVKICTFLQFIKLFKIALFNNKQRDFKTHKNNTSHQNDPNNSLFSSTFIMKVRIKKYNLKNDLIYEQETMLIDLDQNSSNRNNNKEEESQDTGEKNREQNNKKENQSANRSLLDYVLIEINNSNPQNKPIHYHMVQKNLILQIIKKYLRIKQSQAYLAQNVKNSEINSLNKFYFKQQPKQTCVGGQLFIVNSFTTNSTYYQQNIKFYENIQSSIGNQWSAAFKQKQTFKKCLDLNFAQKILGKVIFSIKNRKYSSLRDLYAAKQFYIKESKKIVLNAKQYRNIIIDYLKVKMNLKYSENVFTAFQLQLIGNCIKSDNFKDFYTSKSFLALPRQIQIKTQNIKNQIINYIHGLKQIEEKFKLIKKKETSERRFYTSPPQFLVGSKNTQNGKQKCKFNQKNANQKQSSNKFKLIKQLQAQPIFEQFNDLEEYLGLRKYIYDYFYQIWYKVFFTQQRTITEQILFQEFFVDEISALKEKFAQFIKQVELIEDSCVKCLKDDKLLSLNNFTQLIRSINEAKKSILKYDPKLPGKSPFSLQSINKKSNSKHTKQQIYRTTSYLPKLIQNQSLFQNKQKSMSNSQKLNKKVQIFQIKGKVNFQSMMLKPIKKII